MQLCGSYLENHLTQKQYAKKTTLDTLTYTKITEEYNKQFSDYSDMCTQDRSSPLQTQAIPSTTHASRLDVRKVGWDHANVSIPASKTWWIAQVYLRLSDDIFLLHPIAGMQEHLSHPDGRRHWCLTFYLWHPHPLVMLPPMMNMEFYDIDIVMAMQLAHYRLHKTTCKSTQTRDVNSTSSLIQQLLQNDMVACGTCKSSMKAISYASHCYGTTDKKCNLLVKSCMHQMLNANKNCMQIPTGGTVCPPGLHITLGIFTKLFHLLEAACLALHTTGFTRPSSSFSKYSQELQNLSFLQAEVEKAQQSHEELQNMATYMALVNGEKSPLAVKLLTQSAAKMKSVKALKAKVAKGIATVKKGFSEKEGPFVKQLDSALELIGVQRQQYFGGAFVGNHVHKALKLPNVPRLCAKPSHKWHKRSCPIDLERCHNISDQNFIDEPQIQALD
ncbi:hypothetical protein EMCRGX_G019533 [Ephydatia muelleri]